jgi:hypothetical protein
LYDEQVNEKILFIKDFYKDNNIKLTEKLLNHIKYILEYYDLKESVTMIDFENQSIKEIVYTNRKIMLETVIDSATINLALSHLILNNECDFESSSKIIDNASHIMKEKIKTLSKVNKTINFSHIDLKNVVIKDHRPLLKNNTNIIYYFNSCFYSTINYFKLSLEEIEALEKEIWIFINFYYDVYINHQEYINNSGELNFNTEIEILRKILLFRKENNFIKGLPYSYIHGMINNSFFVPRINKINGLFYIYNPKNLDTYEQIKISNLENFFLIFIINTSISIILKKMYNIYKLEERDIKNISTLMENTILFLSDNLLESKIVNI